MPQVCTARYWPPMLATPTPQFGLTAPALGARKVVPIVSIQNRYNVADRKWEKAVDYCEREGLAFIPWFPLQTGKLASDSALERVAKQHGATPAQVALAWLLHQPGVVVIPKAGRAEHVRENRAALDLGLSPADLADLDAAFPPPKGPKALEML